jgi:metallo-beta-lactamase family protein
MFGEDVPVRCHVEVLGGFSAHADRDDLMRWLRGFTRPPRRVHVVHGEPTVAESLAALVRTELRWDVSVAADGEEVALD